MSWRCCGKEYVNKGADLSPISRQLSFDDFHIQAVVYVKSEIKITKVRFSFDVCWRR